MEDAKPSLQFHCPQCTASLTLPPSTAGQRCRCPRCHFVFQAPLQSEKPPTDPGYSLHRGEPVNVPSNEIPVICHRCQTRMYATLDQVGQMMTCPDCRNQTRVVAPTVAPPPIISPAIGETYALHADTPSASDDPPVVDASLIRVFCPRCETMMYADANQVGTRLICPDCQMAVVVPQAPSKPDPINTDAGQGYELATWKDTSPFTERQTPPPPVSDRRPEPSRHRAVSAFTRPTLPRFPFLTGTFSFPFTPNARPYVLLIAAWAMMTAGIAWQGFAYLAEGSYFGVFTGFFLYALTLCLGIGLFAYGSATALAIVRDTAEGCEVLQTWPDMAFINWFGDAFYVFNAFCVSIAPGVAIAWLLAQHDQDGRVAIPVCLFLLFPFVLLSMLEAPSMFAIFSSPVFRTLWHAGRGWQALLFSHLVVAFAAFGLAVLVLAAGPAWGIILGGLGATVLWFAYFRLLGRLAWYCTDLARKTAEMDRE